jgi:hypothetical protein
LELPPRTWAISEKKFPVNRIANPDTYTKRFLEDKAGIIDGFPPITRFLASDRRRCRTINAIDLRGLDRHRELAAQKFQQHLDPDQRFDWPAVVKRVSLGEHLGMRHENSS